MPFVAMVSQICKMAGVSIMVGDGLLLPPIEPITMAMVSQICKMAGVLRNGWQQFLGIRAMIR